MSLCVPHSKYGIKENKQEFVDGNALTFILLKLNLDPFLLSFFCVQGTFFSSSFFLLASQEKKKNPRITTTTLKTTALKKKKRDVGTSLKGNLRGMNDKRNYLEQHKLHSNTPN